MTSTTLDTPKLAITNATTSRDIIRAGWADPELRDDIVNGLIAAVTNKSLLGTKTFWVSLLTPVVGYVITYYGVGLDGATSGVIVSVLASLAMMVMRYVTVGPVSGVLPGAAPKAPV